jgi:hypothetical protein
MLQAETKASGDTRDRQNYCIPAKRFAAGQIGSAAKLPWTTSNFKLHHILTTPTDYNCSITNALLV